MFTTKFTLAISFFFFLIVSVGTRAIREIEVNWVGSTKKLFAMTCIVEFLFAFIYKFEFNGSLFFSFCRKKDFAFGVLESFLFYWYGGPF